MRPVLLGLLACLLASGCATQGKLREAHELFDQGRGEEGLVLLERAAREHPEDRVYRAEYFRARDMLGAQWLAQAETLRSAQQFDAAAQLYRRVLQYDQENQRAKQGLARIEIDRRHMEQVAEAEKLIQAGKYAEAEDLLTKVLTENPGQREARRMKRVVEEKTARPAVPTELKTSSTKPISLELRDVTLRAVFDVIARAGNVSFLFDREVRTDQKTTVVVRDARIEDVIKLVLVTNQLETRILNDTTALIYPSTPQKQREYQELVVRAFYLANADVRATANMIRTILKTRDVFIDEKLNLLVMKDTPTAIRMAERLIAAQDLAEPEVMLEVEVLEVGTNRLLDLGLRFPQSVAWSLVGGGGTAGVVTLPEWLNRGSNLVRLTFTDPLFLLSLRQQDGRTNVLANPRIRVKNKEKARVHIGDRVPVITTTAAVSGGFLSESVSYLDVGLKLEVEPIVYLDDEVGINVGLEVSNIVREVRGSSGNTLTYQIGTRNTGTVLRLRDGETQILAGLISDEDRRTANRVPGVGDLPVVGHLFSSTSDTRNKTEVVLLITPRIVRALARPDARTVEFAVGTESGASPALGGAPAAPEPAPAPAPPAPARGARGAPPAPGSAAPPAGAPGPTGGPAAPTTVPMVPLGGVQSQQSEPPQVPIR
jgi:general secretion pathway protein D